MGKYTNAGVKYPVFALSSSRVSVGGAACVLCVGGGGSAKSGVPNSLAAFSVKHNELGQPCLEEQVVFETGAERLATTADANLDGRLVAASVADKCLLLELDSTAKTLREVLFWQTDRALKDDEEACQNAVRFSPVDPYVLGTVGDDKTCCIWRIAKPSDVEEKEQGATKPKDTSPNSDDDDEAAEKGDEAQAEAEPQAKGGNKSDDDATDSELSDKEAAEDDGETTVSKQGWQATRLVQLVGHTKEVKDLAFHPLGKQVATVSADKSCRIWDLNTGKPLQVLPADTRASMVFRRLLFVSADQLVTLQARPGRDSVSFLVEFVRESGDELWTLGRSTQVFKGLGTTLHLHPPFLSVGDATGGLTLVDLKSLQPLAHFADVHSLPVTGLSSIPNPDQPGKTYIMTASMDKTVTFLPARRPRFLFARRLVLPLLLVFLVLLFRILFFSEPMDSDDDTLGNSKSDIKEL